MTLIPSRAAAAPDELAWQERVWASIAERGRAYARVPAASLEALERVRQLAKALVSERGEASGAAVARELQGALAALNREERLEFFRFLVREFVPDRERVRRAADAYLTDPSPEHATELAAAADPPRQEVLRRMNLSPGGTATLVKLREELLPRLREEPGLRPLDKDLHHLLSSWFNPGFLALRRIDWQTPAAILEKLIDYEAVHEIQGWDDLRRRLAPDRRCFAFFHPGLPGEPLIFVEVALVQGLASSVQPLLARDTDEAAQRQREAQADTAIFYSISNCQAGLRGVSFGNFLIKQVVEELKAELPRIKQFSTLSPVPRFRRWLEGRLGSPERQSGSDALDLATLSSEDWWQDPARAETLRLPLIGLCAAYLTAYNDGKGPSDPVARFHLGNGARLERINWLGNTAPRGIRESYGIMVNYLYDLDTIEANHESFVRGEVVRSGRVESLLEQL